MYRRGLSSPLRRGAAKRRGGHRNGKRTNAHRPCLWGTPYPLSSCEILSLCHPGAISIVILGLDPRIQVYKLICASKYQIE